MPYNFIDVNFIVNNQYATPKFDAKTWGLKPFELLGADATMVDALVQAGLFKSKGDARKNWTKGFDIPDGYSEWLDIGKAKSSIYILKQTRLFTLEELLEWEEEIRVCEDTDRKNYMQSDLDAYRKERAEIESKNLDTNA